MESPFFDPVGAFVPHGKVIRDSVGSGPLGGLRIAVKDLFDWKGLPTGAGNPTWLATHGIADQDAGAVAALWRAGATLHGKTITDELAYSIHGDNTHYGTPQNRAAPGRVPGGSSSGSAAAVAAGLVEVGLGTDTGGSVRVPAAYTGLVGLRTTHGLVDRSGLVALAPSFDTVGWMASTPRLVEAVAQVLLPDLSSEGTWSKVWVLPEPNALADEETQALVTQVVARLGLPTGDLTGWADAYGGLEGLRKTYAVVQSWEAWNTHGAWITNHRPAFGAAIAQRFRIASQITLELFHAAQDQMNRFRTELRSLLGDGGVLVLPATAGPAPLVGEAEDIVDEIRARTMRLTCWAGLAGLPQITIPFLGGGLPRGVGLLGPAASDRRLISLATALGGV